MKYNLRKIMLKAWKTFRKTKGISFAEALHRAWLSAKAEEINEKRIQQSKAVNTWAGWKQKGFEVLHGTKALFNCSLIWGSKGDGATYKASFFGAAQVHTVTE